MENNKENEQLTINIATKIKEIGGTVYYVGGYVRDKQLGLPNKDIDIYLKKYKKNYS